MPGLRPVDAALSAGFHRGAAAAREGTAGQRFEAPGSRGEHYDVVGNYFLSSQGTSVKLNEPTLKNPFPERERSRKPKSVQSRHHFIEWFTMKKFSLSPPLKAGLALLWCSFWLLSVVVAQTNNTSKTTKTTETDLSETIRNLPKQDGTYCIQRTQGINIYVVMQGGKPIAYETADQNGNSLPFDLVNPAGSSQKIFFCKMCATSHDGTVRVCTTMICP